MIVGPPTQMGVFTVSDNLHIDKVPLFHLAPPHPSEYNPNRRNDYEPHS